ncbi:glucose-6-phosphate dehydrogenase, partial [Candidatus Dojkabacteria bacterium]|nr:glucose-6-phosphate dehydrogenase [Candidatus Dojkabacteria bacterium]
ISLFFNAKKPGENELDSVDMKFLYKEGFERILPEAYESILSEIFKRDKTNFLTTKELEAAWKFVDQIHEYWNTHNNLKYYPAGTNQLV